MNMNWKSFLYKSRGVTTDYYYHWLPDKLEQLIPNSWYGMSSKEEILCDLYKDFDTLTHCTTFENAAEVFRNGFRPQSVSDSSVANSRGELFTPEGMFQFWEL